MTVVPTGNTLPAVTPERVICTVSSPQEEGGVPAYNAAPPPKGTKLPPILGKSELWGADAAPKSTIRKLDHHEQASCKRKRQAGMAQGQADAAHVNALARGGAVA